MKKFFNDFKQFISKGNVLDMAVGVIMGGALSKIVTSLVNDIIMPLISVIIGGLNVTDWKWVIKPAENGQAETALTYGVFLQNVIDFFIIAFCIFLMLKLIMGLQNKIHKPAETSEAEQPAETELDVLKDIRAKLEEKSGSDVVENTDVQNPGGEAE